MSRSKTEIIRRLRLGDLQKLLRSRYGPTLPNDDAGREDLRELLLPVSLGLEAKMPKAIEVWAPWMSADEGTQLIDQINRIPLYERKVRARRLGERLHVTNREREALKLRTIAPCDMTDMQLKELRRAKDRARKQQARRHAGSKRREVYLARSMMKSKPWTSEGISRATWFRKRRGKGRETSPSGEQESHETSPSAIKVLNSRGHTCLTEKTERPKEGLAMAGEGEGSREDAESAESVERAEKRARALGS